MKCQTCQPILTLTPELTHHGKETCSVCGRFIRWVPKPETEARNARNAASIVALRQSSGLTQWEREFISALDEKGPKVSPKQQVVLDKLITRYLQ